MQPAKRDVELAQDDGPYVVRLGFLKVGDTFRVRDGTESGVVVRAGVGYVRVRRTDEGLFTEQVNWGAGTQVIKTGHRADDCKGLEAISSKHRGANMPSPITLRYAYQVRELRKAIAAKDEAKAEGIRNTIRTIAKEGSAAGTLLPGPRDFTDPVFDELLKDNLLRAADTPSPKQAQKALDAATKPPKEPRAPKAPKEWKECLDGCGAMVAGRFKPGHDAKYHGIVRRVEMGKMQISEMPAKMQKELTFEPTTGEDAKFGPYKCTNSAVNHK